MAAATSSPSAAVFPHTPFSPLRCRRQLGLAPADETRAYVQLLVPRALEDRLPAFLQRLEAGQQDLGVTDIQIGLTSLEEVGFARSCFLITRTVFSTSETHISIIYLS